MKLIIFFAIIGLVAASNLGDIAKPLLDKVVQPLLGGLGKGVSGAAPGTQQTTDYLGQAVEALLNTLGGILGQTEIGAGNALQNTAPSVQGTVKALQDNSGLVGDVVKVVGGGGGH